MATIGNFPRSQYKWLWLSVLLLLASIATMLVYISPAIRRPAMLHYVAMQSGVFLSGSLLATLIAAGIKAFAHAKWSWYDWANATVGLSCIVFVFRIWSAQPLHEASNQPVSEKGNTESVSSSASTSIGTVSVVGTWDCQVPSTASIFRITYDETGRMNVVGSDKTMPTAESQTLWNIEDGTVLVHQYSDGVRFTKSRIVRLSATALETIGSNGIQVLCNRST